MCSSPFLQFAVSCIDKHVITGWPPGSAGVEVKCRVAKVSSRLIDILLSPLSLSFEHRRRRIDIPLTADGTTSTRADHNNSNDDNERLGTFCDGRPAMTACEGLFLCHWKRIRRPSKFLGRQLPRSGLSVPFDSSSLSLFLKKHCPVDGSGETLMRASSECNRSDDIQERTPTYIYMVFIYGAPTEIRENRRKSPGEFSGLGWERRCNLIINHCRNVQLIN